MTTLKPCPCCRGNALRDFIDNDMEENDYFNVCNRCGMRTGNCRSPDAADAAWNHRPGEEAVAEECARIAERAMDGIVGAEIAMNIRSRFGGKA